MLFIFYPMKLKAFRFGFFNISAALSFDIIFLRIYAQMLFADMSIAKFHIFRQK